VADLLRVLHFVLLDSSRAVAAFVVGRGFDLRGKTDARFVESAFRLLRDEFRYFPALSVAQFLSPQFVARRLELVADVAAAVFHKQQELQRQRRREEAVWSQPQESGSTRSLKARHVTVENHVIPASVTNHAANILQQLQHVDADPHHRKDERTGQIPGAAALSQAKAKAVDTNPSSESGPLIGERRRDATGHSVRRESGEVQTERPPSMTSTCQCSQDSDLLKKAIGELSHQLSEMAGALLGKISGVEDRLTRLETQMHDVHVTVEEQHFLASAAKPVQHSNTTDRQRTQSNSASSETADLADKRRSLRVEPSCAWPPQPSVFERY
ncbi:hypothetical protein BBJ28_00017499, partial [Nothophytophthora sp. Chile5]